MDLLAAAKMRATVSVALLILFHIAVGCSSAEVNENFNLHYENYVKYMHTYGEFRRQFKRNCVYAYDAYKDAYDAYAKAKVLNVVRVQEAERQQIIQDLDLGNLGNNLDIDIDNIVVNKLNFFGISGTLPALPTPGELPVMSDVVMIGKGTGRVRRGNIISGRNTIFIICQGEVLDDRPCMTLHDRPCMTLHDRLSCRCQEIMHKLQLELELDKLNMKFVGNTRKYVNVEKQQIKLVVMLQVEPDGNEKASQPASALQRSWPMPFPHGFDPRHLSFSSSSPTASPIAPFPTRLAAAGIFSLTILLAAAVALIAWSLQKKTKASYNKI